ncbi:Atn1 protein [Microcystis aeruginosa TAIHU98]|uniref:Atn1 protein n=1 Tax=Microcystis aeruginosa TAIHU98 TaxID=1134457 RepID=L7EES3_MICAE|nr:Atn1 protein [Microcystis aeruginosa TAIHU98]
MLKQQERFTIKGLVYIAIDQTSLGAINILMVSLIYDKRAMPIYWEILDKKGSSNLEEQQRVLGKILTVLSGHKIVVLGDREFCSVSLGKWLQKQSLYFCLRQKKYKCQDKRRNLSRNERVRFKSRNSTIFK